MNHEPPKSSKVKHQNHNFVLFLSGSFLWKYALEIGHKLTIYSASDSIWFTRSTLTCQWSAFRAPLSLKIYPGRMRRTRFCPIPHIGGIQGPECVVPFVGCFSMGVYSQVWTALSPSHLKRTLSGAGLRRGMKHVPPMWLSIRRRPKNQVYRIWWAGCSFLQEWSRYMLSLVPHLLLCAINKVSFLVSVR